MYEVTAVTTREITNDYRGASRVRLTNAIARVFCNFIIREGWSVQNANLEVNRILEAFGYKLDLATAKDFVSYSRIGLKKPLDRVTRVKLFSLFQSAVRHAMFEVKA